MAKQLECKRVTFEIKKLSEEGMFEGLANATGYRDSGGDIVHAGAYTRTIKANGGVFPLLSCHDMRLDIGLVTVEETPKGLYVKEGRLNLETAAGREWYSKLQFYLAHGVKPGMSIGYSTIKVDYSQDKGEMTRHIRELKLREASLLPPNFAMNNRSQVRFVKVDDEWVGDPPTIEPEDIDAIGPVDGADTKKKIDELEAQLKALHERMDADGLAPADPTDSHAEHSEGNDPAPDGDPDSPMEERIKALIAEMKTITKKDNTNG